MDFNGTSGAIGVALNRVVRIVRLEQRIHQRLLVGGHGTRLTVGQCGAQGYALFVVKVLFLVQTGLVGGVEVGFDDCKAVANQILLDLRRSEATRIEQTDAVQLWIGLSHRCKRVEHQAKIALILRTHARPDAFVALVGVTLDVRIVRHIDADG